MHKIRGQIGAEFAERTRMLTDVFHQHRGRVVGLKGQFAREHLPAYHAKRVDVRAPVHLTVAHRLLGAHIRRRANGDPLNREPLIAFGGARNAEVGNHGTPALVVEQYVVGFDVAMHHLTRMRVGERVAHLAQHTAHRGHIGARRAMQALRERFSLNKPHREVHDAVEIVHRVNGNDVGMRQLRGHLRLAQEAALHILAKRELRRQHFERHQSAQPYVARPIHHGHPATADFCLNGE